MADVRWVFRLGALPWLAALFAPVAASAARPERDEPDEPLEREERLESDDPADRFQAMAEWRGRSDPAARLRILDEALKERDRWAGTALRAASPRTALAAVPGSVFVNIGPTAASRAHSGDNGDPDYFENDSGRARQIVPHPADPNVLYLATSGGGVWKSWDQGATWEPITDQLGTLSVGAVAMDPSAPEILYLGFGDPFDVQQPGIVRSLDGGITWQDRSVLQSQWTVNTQAVTLTASMVTDIKAGGNGTVLVATDAGLFRSADFGKTYQPIALTPQSPPVAGTLYPLVWSIAPAGPSVWLVTAEGVDPAGKALPGLGIWRSTDDGATFTWTPAGLPLSAIGRATLAAAPSTLDDPETARLFLLAAAADGSSQQDVHRTEDGGRTWFPLGVNANGRPVNTNADQLTLDVLRLQAWYNQAILVDPANPDAVFIGGQFSMMRSGDAGLTWEVLSNWLPVRRPTPISRAYVHADFHAFAIGADGRFYAGTDGGLARSPGSCGAPDCSARTARYQDVTFASTPNIGVVSHMAYHVACAAESWPAELQGWVAGGLQDNGTRVRVQNGTVFDQVVGGDGIGLAVSASAATTHAPAVPGIPGIAGPDVFLTSVARGLFASVDGGATWQPFTTGLPRDNVPFLVRIVRDEKTTSDFLTFTSPAAVWRSNATASWQNVSGTLRWPNGQTFTGFKAIGGGAITLRNLATHPVMTGHWGAVSNRFAYFTTNGGANWNGSNPIAPNNDVNQGSAYLLSSIAFDPADSTSQTFYATSKAMDLAKVDASGTATGTIPMPPGFGHLYVTTNGGQTWDPVGVGSLPMVPFNVVKFDPNDPNTLYVGTEIGLYRSSDRGVSWQRYGAGIDPARPLGLPLVEVTDLCIAGGRLTVSTYGRGFWQIGSAAIASSSGVRGRGDTNFDGRIDGRDLLDLADSFNAAGGSASYRYQADLAGTTNQIDRDDLNALLAKFGGKP